MFFSHAKEGNQAFTECSHISASAAAAGIKTELCPGVTNGQVLLVVNCNLQTSHEIIGSKNKDLSDHNTATTC